MESIKLGENHNGRSRPSIKVPLGEFIMSRTPQLVIAPFTFDHTGSPICVETYKFRPGQVFKGLTIDEYIRVTVFYILYGVQVNNIETTIAGEKASISGFPFRRGQNYRLI